jgi:hypothetical protein
MRATATLLFSICISIFGINALIFPHVAYASEEKVSFSSYDEAKSYVRSNFASETAETSRSSWIRGLEWWIVFECPHFTP